MAIVTGTNANDLLQGTDGDDVIRGLDGDDVIIGGFGVDQLYGDAGNDTFRFSSIAFSSATTPKGLIDGGSGYDALDLRNVTGVTLGTINGSFGVYIGSQHYTLQDIEQVQLGGGNEFVSLLANTGSTVRIDAGAGDDYLNFSGNYDVYGGDGNDRFFVSGQFSGVQTAGIISGGAGVDTLALNILSSVDLSAGILTATGSKFLVSDFENIEVSVYDGGQVPTAIGDDGANVLSVNSTNDGQRTGVVFDSRGGADKLTGSMGADSLMGGGGNDIIDGRGGNDRLMGGDGDDVFIVGAGDDLLIGGSGFDTTTYSDFFRIYKPLTADGSTILMHSDTGIDRLSEMEQIRFRDGVLSFDGDHAWAQVMRLYDTVIGREPDRGGLEYYTDLLQDGKVTLKDLANSFMESGEFKKATGGLSDEEFVKYTYQNALGRQPDGDGLSYWVKQLSGDTSRADMILTFSESGEHRDQISSILSLGYFDSDDTYQAVTLIYDSAVGRTPDPSGLTYYAEGIKAGQQTLLDVANAFVNSQEFSGKTAGMSNGALVTFMFENTLDRAPDAEGQSYWTGRLDNGMSRADLLLAFSQSPEHHQLLAPVIQDGIFF